MQFWISWLESFVSDSHCRGNDSFVNSGRYCTRCKYGLLHSVRFTAYDIICVALKHLWKLHRINYPHFLKTVKTNKRLTLTLSLAQTNESKIEHCFGINVASVCRAINYMRRIEICWWSLLLFKCNSIISHNFIHNWIPLESVQGFVKTMKIMQIPAVSIIIR